MKFDSCDLILDFSFIEREKKPGEEKVPYEVYVKAMRHARETVEKDEMVFQAIYTLGHISHLELTLDEDPEDLGKETRRLWKVYSDAYDAYLAKVALNPCPDCRALGNIGTKEMVTDFMDGIGEVHVCTFHIEDYR